MSSQTTLTQRQQQQFEEWRRADTNKGSDSYNSSSSSSINNTYEIGTISTPMGPYVYAKNITTQKEVDLSSYDEW